jgi:agmatine deiminase
MNPIFGKNLNNTVMKRVGLLLIMLFLVNVALISQNAPAYKRAHFLSEEEMRNYDPAQSKRDFTPTDPPPSPVRQTAEFERMQSILVRYPFGIPFTMIAEISEDCGVTTIVTNQSQENTVRNQYLANGVNMDNCDFMYAPTDSYWTRDYGPWFVTKHPNEFGIVDFPYNRPSRPNDDDFPIAAANSLGIDLYGMPLIHTGGNYMTDGLGVGASTTLVYTENPDLTHAQVDSLVSSYLNIQTYHVVDDPLGDYIEHIDCWGKFIDVDKIIIGEVPTWDNRYDDFEAVADYFANQVSSYGNNYQVYRVFTPGDGTETPYSNSLIVNDKVLVPQTGHEYDDEALAVYEEAMPGYEIIGIYYDGWYNTDAIHCRSRGIVDQGLLYVQHFPLLENQEWQEQFEITATITSYSGSALKADSINVFYKVYDGVYSKLDLQHVFGFKYHAFIPAQEIGSKISYYIYAADESGRHEMHPFIGPADPHLFTVVANENPDIVFAPDSLIFTTDIQAFDGLDVVVYNHNPVDVVINNIENEGFDAGFRWYVDPWTVELPYTLAAGDSLTMTVKIDMTLDNLTTWLIDSMAIETAVSTQQLVIMIDQSLVGIDENPNAPMLLAYPNPFGQKLDLQLNNLSEGDLRIEMYSALGKKCFVVEQQVGNQASKIIRLESWTENLPNGIYYLKVFNGSKEDNLKIIKLD